jgi:hypothetical protein
MTATVELFYIQDGGQIIIIYPDNMYYISLTIPAS